MIDPEHHKRMEILRHCGYSKAARKGTLKAHPSKASPLALHPYWKELC